VEKNQVYEEGVFEKKQKEHRNLMFNQFEQNYLKVLNLLKNIFKNFRDGTTEVQREWRSQISQVFYLLQLLL
jgi:hypothetical protein